MNTFGFYISGIYPTFDQIDLNSLRKHNIKRVKTTQKCQFNFN